MSWKDLKQKGNDLFTQQDYKGAVTFYAKALEQAPLEHTLYSNRSVALCKLECYEDALQDSVKCVELEPNFSRGYLRKSVALNKLRRYEEAMEAAQLGYKLRGSDAISKNCMAEWLVAVQAMLKEKVDGIQSEIDFKFPKAFVVISDDYLTLLVDVFVAYANSTTEASVEGMAAHLTRILKELDRVLQVFGHSPNPCGNEWVGALCDASKLDPSSLRVPSKALANVMGKSEQLVTWLQLEVDHILYPVLQPLFSLAVMVLRNRFINLNFLAIDYHVVEVGCRACLPFFEKSLLSTPECAEQHIEIYSDLFGAIGANNSCFEEPEVKSTEGLVRNFELLLERNIHCDADIIETARICLGLVRVRLGQDPGFGDMPFKHVLMSSCSIEEVLSFIEEKEQPLKSLLDLPLEDQLPDTALRDSQVMLSCTGVLLKAGLSARAAEIFELGETVSTSILQRRLLLESFTLDTAPLAFLTMQGNILLAAKKFLGVNDKLLADVIIRWKCILSEFRALLMQLGMGAKYFATFKAIQQIHLRREVGTFDVGDQLIQVAEDHQREVHRVIRTKGRFLLNILLQQNHEQFQSVLKPGQMILEYCPAEDHSTYELETTDPGIVPDGLLLVIQPNEAPVIKLIDTEKVSECVHKNVANRSFETLGATQELCNLIIPEEIQDVLCSGRVQQVLVCPESSFSQVPLELLPLRGGQQLGKQCTVVHLSAARELLRRSTLLAAQDVTPATAKIPITVGTCETRTKQDSNTQDKESHDFVAEPTTDDLQSQSPAAQAHTQDIPSKHCIIFADPNYDLEQVGEDSGVLEKLITSMSALFLNPPLKTNLASPLPKSRDEAHEVEYTLAAAENPLDSCCVLGDEATVSSVLQVDSPFVLHFSTHGFSEPTRYGSSGTFLDDTKSGLLLAGANTYRRGDLSKIVPAAGIGVLTALAAMGMNLHNTSLVYLSTCLSASGAVVSGESINSLAEAFRVAGARTVVATLWPVVDEEAKILAVHFYREVCKTGVRPSQALASAKRKMEESGYHTVLWSSFICLGEDVPLFPSTSPHGLMT